MKSRTLSRLGITLSLVSPQQVWTIWVAGKAAPGLETRLLSDGPRSRGWNARLAAMMAGLALAACASTPQLFVINETGQALDVVFATNTRFHLNDRLDTQTVRGFPNFDWTLK